MGASSTKKFPLSFLPWQVMIAKEEPGKLFLLPLQNTLMFLHYTRHGLEMASPGSSLSPRGKLGAFHISLREGPWGSARRPPAMTRGPWQCYPLQTLCWEKPQTPPQSHCLKAHCEKELPICVEGSTVGEKKLWERGQAHRVSSFQKLFPSFYFQGLKVESNSH